MWIEQKKKNKGKFDSRFCNYFIDLSIIIRYFSVHLVDIWNVIDAFRQATFCNQQFTYTTLEQLLSYIFEQLNKRLPPSQNVDVASSTRVLYGFLIQAYDRYANAFFL